MIDMTNEDLRDEWRDQDDCERWEAMSPRARVECDAVMLATQQARASVFAQSDWAGHMRRLDAALAARLGGA